MINFKINFLLQFLFFGRKAPIRPSLPVYEYYKKINVSHKEYIWFENAGHI